MTTRPRVLLMHPILEPGRRALSDACDIVVYPAGLSLTERLIRAWAEGCSGIVSQMMDPIAADVLSLPGLRIVTNIGAPLLEHRHRSGEPPPCDGHEYTR